MRRTFVLWALIVLVGIINLRMICVDHSVQTQAQSHCTDTCPRKEPPPDEDTTGCVLVAGGCALIGAVAEGLPVPLTVAFARPAVNVISIAPEPDLYLPPSSSPLSPPPKA